MLSPYIHENEKEYCIIGSKESLNALGEMLIQKSKIGTRLSTVFTDGVNKPIRILINEDILEYFKRLEEKLRHDNKSI